MSRLIIVGSGIKSLAHLTKETIVIVEKADKVLFLTNDQYTSDYIKSLNGNAESLEQEYFSCSERIKSYERINRRIIHDCSIYDNVCVVFYGHPTFFVDSSLKVINDIKALGGEGYIIPAISSLDCLLSDLLINPAKMGLNVYDATDFLVFNRVIDTFAYLILFQVSNLGTSDFAITKNIMILKDFLLKYYPENHEICLYSASQYPGQKFIANLMSLKKLDLASLSHQTTLCIPPLKNRKINQDIVSALGLDLIS